MRKCYPGAIGPLAIDGVFGKWNHEMLDDGYLEPYSAAAGVIEASTLDYTIVRPAWLTDTDEVNYRRSDIL